MKNNKIISSTFLILLCSSCSFFNKKTVDVSINSNPSGASVYIEGKNYGQTPLTLNIEPKPYDAVIVKEGYGSINHHMDIWYGTIRTDIDGERTADGTRCFLDTMSLLFAFNAWNATRCGDFKEKVHNVIIPRSNNFSANSSMGAGRKKSDIINYYYNNNNPSNNRRSQY
jgi:hypothetical protein